MCGTPLALRVIGGLPSMPAPLIPWRVFFQALSTRKYKQKHLQSWLGRWAFSDAGTALVDGGANYEATSLSLEEKQKLAAFFDATRGKRPKIIH
jgi:hypothetical protein